jgi:hypothetical protein
MIFITNKYTRIYYAITSRAKLRAITKGHDKHHVIPESFYLHRKRKGRKGWLLGDPNSPDNIVYLTQHEHFVCHLLLTKMVDTVEAQHKVDSAAAWVMDTYTSKNSGVRITGRIYAKLRKAAAEAQSARKTGQVAPIKGMTAWSNGIVDVMAFESPGKGFVKGSKHTGNKKAHSKGTKWWNNGTELVMSKECPGQGWVLGNMKTYDQLATCLGRKKWNNGIIEITSVDCPGPDFALGRILKGKYKGNKQGLYAWNNGKTIKFSIDCPGEGFILGGLKRPKKKLS